MYKKLYEQPLLKLCSLDSDVIIMSGGTAYDDGKDNVVGGALNLGGLG